MRTGNGMIVQHAAAAFLQKTFSYCIDADKKLYDPEQPVPYGRAGVFNSHEQNKNGGAYV